MRQVLLLILLFFIGHWLTKSLRRANTGASQRTGNPARPGGPAGAPTAGAQPRASARPQLAEPIIRCAECGVHAPQSESVMMSGQPFCCADHAQRHAARTAPRDVR